MSELARRVLRVVIVLLFAGLLFFQAVLLPLLGVDIAEGGDDVVHLRWPVVVIGILGVATVEVVLVCIWRLLTMVRADTVFSRSAFRYVDVIIGAIAVAAGLLLLLGVVLAPGEAVPPGMVLALGIVAMGVGGIALLVLVLRALLAKAVALDSTATTLRAELDEVI
ncbi:DUF2975 domain-containing protein [Cellulomonas hominis]|jgi:hypothetical protein|uniref:Transporter n=1 Tax=Cellulomonas hominis TaxID=156981 RepID=A0A511F8D1_9CELL|nr:DUF2975 domain-containing protein [Cellulomonas hominis]MBB5473099.1 hypothetical protein [Cellulomonas hominis]MBU5422507.1 DUF2975 domain-containing protein [Cellulomonas hominis]NKY06024.1 DUF2975 domain-containing protein [Cellulomonas hominis]GEL45473.1 transporter [Cellulomonas hominis]